MMSSRRAAYKATSNMILVNQDDCPADTLEAVLVSCSTSLIQESTPPVAVTENHAKFGNAQKKEFYAVAVPSAAETSEETCDDADVIDDLCVHQAEKKRRLSTEQVKLLERSFETENKLEPDRKMQLARDLNLQPRQVAVWFQNRRARWKTKRLEKDYDLLKGNYNSLKVDYDSLLRERDQLQMELNSLRSKLQGNGDEDNLDKRLDSTELVAADDEADASSAKKLRVNTVSCVTKVEPLIERLKDSSSATHEADAVADASSPQPIASGLSKITSQSTNADPSEIAVPGEDDMSSSKAVCLHTYQEFLKPREDSVEDETYNKYLYTIVDDDDQPPFTWWNWP